MLPEFASYHTVRHLLLIFHILINNPTNNMKYDTKTTSVKIEFHIFIASKLYWVINFMLFGSFHSNMVYNNIIFDGYKL